VANPGWGEKLYDRLLGYTIALCKRSAAAGVDMLEFWGDVAMQDRMIVPPERWRALDKQAWSRIIRETRKVRPDVKFFFHCDGNLTPIIEDIIEVGFDILNPLQPECLNPGLVKAKWGRRLTLDGGGSVQRTLPFGTVEDVRREVDFLMRCCAYDGGYIFRASNAVSFDCLLQNVVTFYETARDYDLSKLEGPPEVIPDPPPCMSVPVRPTVSYDMVD
jgi:uroporphyrinogen decarboxylase